MASPMKVVPSAEKVKTGIKDIAPIADGLAGVLADTYRLIFKTHAYHWNVEGPLFYSIHRLTETQYQDMFAAADELAERIRALGRLAPGRLSEIVERSSVADLEKLPSAEQMVEDLAADHARVALRLRDLVDVAEERKDAVTADLATERCAFHEQAAWMLRVTAK
ncbi:MAG: DNA starvation/stationary phase protection protein [Rhodobacteraceae bacterium]|nr:DNA starvation/stationary phase protection protein [Paracoccaceae bacterium]